MKPPELSLIFFQESYSVVYHIGGRDEWGTPLLLWWEIYKDPERIKNSYLRDPEYRIEALKIHPEWQEAFLAWRDGGYWRSLPLEDYFGKMFGAVVTHRM